MKVLTKEELQTFLESLDEHFDLRLPVRLSDGTRAMGRPGDGPLAIEGGRLPRKPTELFFPQHDLVFTAEKEGSPRLAGRRERPLLAVGFTARDLDCLTFVDRFFASGFADDIYGARRNGALVVGVSGRCAPEGEFLPMAGGNCDLELICDGRRWIVAAYSEAGREIEDRIVGGKMDDSWEELLRQSEALPNEERELLARASELLREDRVPDGFWEEIGDRCIACTGCNLCCPTCTCFGVQDRDFGDRVERSRMWDSCQLGGFMREAGGHNPLGTEELRTRRRIHHKLAADVERWGEISCFLCGRCDDVCPTGIGIQAVAGEIVARFGGGRRS